mmetsp:Transcript_26267/g.36596  ORF Transcript_26267/g.36596 Transcript_26267/m.36596 type:complete len:611 (-) Transcript_26267:98-1930(-)
MHLGCRESIILSTSVGTIVGIVFTGFHAVNECKARRLSINTNRASEILKTRHGVLAYDAFCLIILMPFFWFLVFANENSIPSLCSLAVRFEILAYNIQNFLLYRLLLAKVGLVNARPQLKKVFNVFDLTLFFVYLPIVITFSTGLVRKFGVRPTSVANADGGNQVCGMEANKSVLATMLFFDLAYSIIFLGIFTYLLCNPPRRESKKRNLRLVFRTLCWSFLALVSTSMFIVSFGLLLSENDVVPLGLVTFLCSVDVTANLTCLNLTWDLKYYYLVLNYLFPKTFPEINNTNRSQIVSRCYPSPSEMKGEMSSSTVSRARSQSRVATSHLQIRSPPMKRNGRSSTITGPLNQRGSSSSSQVMSHFSSSQIHNNSNFKSGARMSHGSSMKSQEGETKLEVQDSEIAAGERGISEGSLKLDITHVNDNTASFVARSIRNQHFFATSLEQHTPETNFEDEKKINLGVSPMSSPCGKDVAQLRSCRGERCFSPSLKEIGLMQKRTPQGSPMSPRCAPSLTKKVGVHKALDENIGKDPSQGKSRKCPEKFTFNNPNEDVKNTKGPRTRWSIRNKPFPPTKLPSTRNAEQSNRKNITIALTKCTRLRNKTATTKEK